jgi:hypothetical protein
MADQIFRNGDEQSQMRSVEERRGNFGCKRDVFSKKIISDNPHIRLIVRFALIQGRTATIVIDIG